MKVKLTEQQFRRIILKEQDNNYDSVGELYNQVVAASAGWGTDPNAINLAISKLNLASSEINDFLSRFKDKKSGYDSFNKMINGEYDFWNLPDIKEIEKILNNSGVVVYKTSTKPFTGEIGFSGGFKFTPITTSVPPLVHCVPIYKDQLPKAVKWWKDWLNDITTQNKFKNNHNITSMRLVERIFSMYKKALDKAYIYPYNDDKSSTIAFVKQKIIAPGRIWVNCSKTGYYDTKEKVISTLIHELQHQLHYIHPLNPGKQIGDLFVNPDTDKLTPQDIEDGWDFNKSVGLPGDNEYKKIESDIKKLMPLEEWRRTIKRISIELNITGHQIRGKKWKSKEEITASLLRKWYEYSVSKKPNDPSYGCRATEKGSNIASIRKILKIRPSDGITVQMLKPYILGQVSDGNTGDVNWLLVCWSQKGFVSLKSFVAEFNELADTITTGEDSISDTMT